MPRRKAPQPEPCSLVAIIEAVEQTYYISEHGDPARASDEALIEIIARIEQITPRLKQHLHRQIEITLACARFFSREDRTPPTDHPFLLPIQLRKGRCSFMAYLPGDPFWALRPMITSGAITHIEALFAQPHRGSGDLQGIHFAPASKLVMPDHM